MWDSVTHDYGFAVQKLDFLGEEYGELPLYRWLQHGSTVVGSLVVAVIGVRALRQHPLALRDPLVGGAGWWWSALGVTAVVAALVLRDPEAVVGVMLVAFVGAAGVWGLRST
jgi:hypothetical protein